MLANSAPNKSRSATMANPPKRLERAEKRNVVSTLWSIVGYYSARQSSLPSTTPLATIKSVRPATQTTFI